MAISGLNGRDIRSCPDEMERGRLSVERTRKTEYEKGGGSRLSRRRAVGKVIPIAKDRVIKFGLS